MNLLQIHEPGQTPPPHAGEVSAAVGIDLGTTHSLAAFSDGKEAQVLRNIHGHALVPSVVWRHEGKVSVGYEAKAAWEKGDQNAVGSFKRHMHEAANRLAWGITPVELSAEILKELKRNAERALGREVTQAVITVPAYFDDAARVATKDAARLAGLTVLRLINEPTAAALAYGLEKGAEGIYAIYDLGGGTFDISLLKLHDGVFQVLATGGDTQLGGDDFDDVIAKHLNIPASEARKIKEQRSSDFETLIAPLVARSIAVCERVFKDAKLAAKDVKGVVLVGGSTRVPLVQREVEKCFGKKPLTDVNPDEVVAIGAAIQAHALTAGAEHLLLDVNPLSLGLATMGGLMEKLIERNSPIPAAATQEFTTYQDNQTGMEFTIVQGEREMAADNRELAKFSLTGIPPLPAGIARVAVTFAVDADGVLSVSAQEKTTGVRAAVEVKPASGISAEDMIAMLQASQQHAKEDILKRLAEEAKIEAERNIIELESAMKQDAALLTDAEKKLITAQIGYVREAINEGDCERMDAELQQLAALANPFAERRMNDAIGKALKGSKI